MFPKCIVRTWPGNHPTFGPTTCNANVSCDGSLSFACGVCVWRFSLCVFSLENPYRGKLSCRRSEPERKHCFSKMANAFAKKAHHNSQEHASQFGRQLLSR